MARTTQLLANAYAAQGESDKALELYQEVVLDVFRVEVGPHHPDYADVLFNIGLVAFDAGDYAAAQERLESALKIELATLGPGSTRAARTRVKLAETLLERQQPDAALEHAHAAWAVQSKLPESHSDRRAALVIVASAELDAKQYEPALVHHEQLVEQYGAHDDPFVLHNIAWASCQVRACEGARPRLEQARVQADALLQDRESLDETSVLWLELLRLHTDHTEALVEQAAGHWARARTLLKHTRQQALALELPPEDTSLGTQRDKLLREIDTNLEKLQRAR